MLPTRLSTAFGNCHLRRVYHNVWQAKCPGHMGEGHSSLSLKIVDSRVLVHCFAGCSTEYVLERVGLTMADLFLEKNNATSGNYCSAASDLCGWNSGRGSDETFRLRDEVYRCLLSHLDLSPEHEASIKKRGIQNPYELGYRSTTKLPEARKYVEAVYGRERVERVPGFRVSKYPDGFIFPVRGRRGEYLGLLLRTNVDRRKYVWFSGNGVSVGQVVGHPAGIPTVCDNVRLTEGPLKADVCWSLDKAIPTLGISGVSSWPVAIHAVQQLGAKTVHVAFDQDYRTNEAVKKSLLGLLTALRDDGYNVLVESWDSKYKGIDDAMVAGAKIESNPLTQEFLDRLKPEQKEDTYSGKSDVVVCLADVKPRKVEWLWDGWLPIGNVTIMDGDPGLGKSQITCSLAASVTNDVGFAGSTSRKSGRSGVVFMTAEDSAENTIVPRLMACGADLTKCHQLKFVRRKGVRDLPSLPEDIDRVREVVLRTGSRLLVVDPLFSYIGSGTDTHKDQEVRKVMQALFQLAEQQEIAVLVLRHLNKGGGNGNAVYRGSGSIGVIASCRVGWMVGTSPDVKGEYVLAQTKNNLAAMPASLLYRVVDEKIGDGIHTSRIDWQGTTEHVAGDILSSNSRQVEVDYPGWLCSLLSSSGGSLDACGLKRACDRAGKNYARILRIRSVDLADYGIVRGDDHVWRLVNGTSEEGQVDILRLTDPGKQGTTG